MLLEKKLTLEKSLHRYYKHLEKCLVTAHKNNQLTYNAVFHALTTFTKKYFNYSSGKTVTVFSSIVLVIKLRIEI